jgi:hypothetical protein
MPGPIQQRRLHSITLNSPATQLYWAVVRSLLTMIAMPVLRLKPMGVLLVGEQAVSIRDAIGRAFACATAKLTLRTTPSPTKIKKRFVRHLWPIVLDLPAMDSRAQNTFFTIPPDFCVAATSSIDAGQALAAGWWLVEAGHSADGTPLIESFAADVLLSFLPEVLLRHRDLRNDSAGAEQALWTQFMGWFATKCRGRTAINASTALIQFPAHIRVSGPLTPTQLDGNAEADEIRQVTSSHGTNESVQPRLLGVETDMSCAARGEADHGDQVQGLLRRGMRPRTIAVGP